MLNRKSISIVLLSIFLITSENNCTGQQFYFRSLPGCHKDWIQTVNIAETVIVDTDLNCARSCHQSPECFGFKFCPGTGSCDIQQYVANLTDVQCSDLYPQPGCFYVNRLSCLNGGLLNTTTWKCECERGFEGHYCEIRWKDCSSQLPGQTNSGLVDIQPYQGRAPFPVQCYSGNTVVFRRTRFNDDLFMNRTWDDYRNGFFVNANNYWTGLEDLYRLLQLKTYRLVVGMHPYYPDPSIIEYHAAIYYNFSLEDQSLGYALHFNTFATFDHVAGDGFAGGRDRPFCTPDRDCGGCATATGFGWWYDADCFHVNVTNSQSQDVWPENDNGTFPFRSIKAIWFTIF